VGTAANKISNAGEGEERRGRIRAVARSVGITHASCRPAVDPTGRAKPTAEEYQELTSGDHH
jgi:hypothetical protein